MLGYLHAACQRTFLTKESPIMFHPCQGEQCRRWDWKNLGVGVWYLSIFTNGHGSWKLNGWLGGFWLNLQLLGKKDIFLHFKGKCSQVAVLPFPSCAFGITSTGYQKAYRFRGPRDVFSCNLGKNQGQNPLDAKSLAALKPPLDNENLNYRIAWNECR